MRLEPPPIPEVVPVEEARRAWVRPAVYVVFLSAAAIAAWSTGLPSHLTPEALRLRAASLGGWAPALLLAGFLVRPLLLLPITPLWIACGALFGLVEGTMLAVAGTAAGAGVGFGLARRLGRDFVERRLGRRLRRLRAIDQGDGLRTVLALQLTPIVPHDLINNLAGVSRMPYLAFFLGSLLGTIPIILVYAYVGNAVLEIPSPPFWIALGVLTALTAVMLLWGRRGRRRRARREPEPEPGGSR